MSPQTDDRPIDRVLMPIQRFMRVEAAGGVLLLGATALALIWANSPWAASYDTFWHTYLKFAFGGFELKLSLAHFVNDGLMAIFFFVVGLEIKREMLVGELASFRKAAVPIAAAVGGMAVPALIFAAVVMLRGGEGLSGWGVPMATDIAFAVGIMAMLGKRVPLPLKIFLTALAIVDDIGAVLVIAIFYTSEISMVALGVAGGLLLLAVVANVAGVRTPLAYAIIGIVMWVMLLQSGVHATIGGVLLALTIPAKMRIRGHDFVDFAGQAIDAFRSAGGDDDNIMTNPQQQRAVHGLEEACEHVQAPLGRLEHDLHGFVAFVIMPIFALANAGLALGGDVGGAMTSGVGMGVVLGLFLGKPIGIMLFTWLAVVAGLGDLPAGSNWKQVLGASFLAGIGFTMSLFIANLAFRGADGATTLQFAKTGILAGSLVSGVVGFVLLRTASGATGGDGAGR
jgi:NhaA family Na+:H+ antiporter